VTIAPIAPSPLPAPASCPPREPATALPRESSRGGLNRSMSVVICTYTEARWDLLVRAVRSASGQSLRPAQIVVVIDHCPALMRRARQELASAAGVDDRRQLTIISNSGQPGLSDARNTGVRAARRSIVAFLDDDAEADPTWLSRLGDHYENPAVVGVGGQVLPEWEASRPAWFPPEFDWVIGCTYRGMPRQVAPIRNLMGANMSFRRDALLESGGFSADLGRIGSRPLGCEETDLCIRLTSRDAKNVLLYDPNAVVQHHVPTTRARWGYFRARCYAEGLSKAQVRSRAGSGRVLSSERSYVLATLPAGVATALGGVGRGRIRTTARAATIVAGVGATVSGYLVGRLGRHRATSAASRSPLTSAASRSPLTGPPSPIPAAAPSAQAARLALASVAALPVALLLWVFSLFRVDLGQMSDLGLVSVLPVTFWLALALLTTGFGLAVTRPTPRRGVLVAYAVSLVLILHATPTLLYDTLRYAWAWKHVGLIDYLLRHGATDPHIGNDLAAYQDWPGFFAGNALLIKAAGLRSALSYAAWGPPFFDLLVLGPLVLIFRRFTQDQRLIWTGVWLFILGNWVGQDYFSPQAAAYFLYLVVIAITLRWFSSSSVALAVGDSRSQTPGVAGPLVPMRRQPLRRAGILITLVVLVVAIATSHQLTPLMLIAAFTALVIFRRCSERSLPVVTVVLTVGWILLAARGFLSTNFSSIAASFGRPDSNAQANLLNLSHASPGQVVVAQIDRLLSASLWILGMVGVWRRWRTRHGDLPLVLLALAPLPLIVANSYGGEMVFRVYLFSLPFVAFFAAAAFFPRVGAGRSRYFPAVLTGISLVLLVAFLFSYYGEEQVNYFSPQEVAATSWLYAHAPAGSLIVGPSGDLPWEYRNIESYSDYWFALDTPKGRQEILADPVGSLHADLSNPRYPASYLIFSRAQAAEVDTTGLMPAGSVSRIERDVLASGLFRVVFENANATIVTAQSQGGGR
jgi:GT2 family glycosyltransferase